MQRGVFLLVGLFNFHSVPLCGGPYPLPCRTMLRVRDALHPLEACDCIAHGRRFPAAPSVAWRKRTSLQISESRAGVVSFAIIFFLRLHLSARTHRAVMHRQYQSTQCSIRSWNHSWTIEGETVSEGRRRVC